MIVLDTNVLAEAFRPSPSVMVMEWLAGRRKARLATARAGGACVLGRPISQFDAMIAAVASSHRAVLATRNVGDFEHCGLRIVNPWHS